MERTGTAAGDRIGLGIAGALVAVFCFAIVDAAAKWLGQGYSPFQIVFLRYLIGLVPLALLIWRAGGPRVLRTARPGAQALRAALLFVALTSFFAGLAALPLAEAIAVSFTAPLFVAALSGPLLAEPVGPRRWAAVGVGFFGAMIMLRPGSQAFQPAALLVVLSALTFALGMLLTRHLVRTESSEALLTYSTIGAGLMSLPFALVTWRWPGADDLAVFLLLGGLGSIGAYLFIVAHRRAPAIVVAPFQYTALVWGAVIGWLVWAEVPAPAVWLGAGIIVCSGFYLTRQEIAPKPEP